MFVFERFPAEYKLQDSIYEFGPVSTVADLENAVETLDANGCTVCHDIVSCGVDDFFDAAGLPDNGLPDEFTWHPCYHSMYEIRVTRIPANDAPGSLC
jgi:hypothetical protein